MKIDFGDVFASGIGWLLKQLFLFTASIWLSRSMGAAALIAGELAGWVGEFNGEWLPITVAWITCAVLIVMMGTGVWFLHQWQINRWAGEIAAPKAENAMRRAELEREFGTKSAGADELGFD
jgi:hypothetical protein